MKNADGALRRINFSMRNGIRICKNGLPIAACLRDPLATGGGGLTSRLS